MFAEPPTAPAVMVNATEADPAGMVTVAGTAATLGLDEVTVITVGWKRGVLVVAVIVTLLLMAVLTVAGVSVRLGWLIVKSKGAELPALGMSLTAVISTVSASAIRLASTVTVITPLAGSVAVSWVPFQ